MYSKRKRITVLVLILTLALFLTVFGTTVSYASWVNKENRRSAAFSVNIGIPESGSVTMPANGLGYVDSNGKWQTQKFYLINGESGEKTELTPEVLEEQVNLYGWYSFQFYLTTSCKNQEVKFVLGDVNFADSEIGFVDNTGAVTKKAGEGLVFANEGRYFINMMYRKAGSTADESEKSGIVILPAEYGPTGIDSIVLA